MPLSRKTKRGFGCKAGPPITGPSTRLLFGAPSNLPKSHTLLPHSPPLYDQGQTSSCVGQAIANAIDIRLRSQGTPRTHPSALGIYTLARELERTRDDAILVDEGSVPSIALAAIGKVGIPREDKWPFSEDPKILNASLPLDVLDEGEGYQLTDYALVDTTNHVLDDVRNALAHDFPVTLATQVDDAFDQYTASSPPIGRPKGQIQGGHYVCLVGYNDDGTFQLLNSWGAGWGKLGVADVTGEFVEACTDLAVIRVVPTYPGKPKSGQSEPVAPVLESTKEPT